jgi:uncharacterized protein (TIGR00251 family)
MTRIVEPPFTITEGRARMAVRLTPRARRDEIAGLVDAGEGRTALAVRLAAPPVDGAANSALVAFLARTLGIPRTSIAIVSGERSRLKMLAIEGVDAAMLARLL